MYLKSVTIKNYKSIVDSQIKIESIGNKTCSIFLGVNESGKSNVLEAISLLDSGKPFDYTAMCNNKAEEDRENIEISFDFLLKDFVSHKDLLLKSGFNEELVEGIKINKIEKHIYIKPGNVREEILLVRIEDNKKLFSKFSIDDNQKFYIKDNVLSKTIEEIPSIEVDNNKDIIKSEKVEEEKLKEIKEINKEVIEIALSEVLKDFLNNKIPKIIFWKMESKYLITEKIDLNIFKDDQNLSIPLKNCFLIAGISDINYKINSINGNIAKLSQLKDLLNEKVTDHIKNKWKENKISIRFEIDGMQLSFLVEEDDNTLPKYEVSQRSDGFKHFISILLNISAENTTENLHNNIILLDEPEIHLHPTGAKFLRDELLKISENNIVFYATHSIYMVDKENLNRHFSVKKEKGTTYIDKIERDDPYKEEVLYESLGTSILEHIEEKVLIVEGKTDRDIFNLYKNVFSKELSIPNITIISADGVDNIYKYTKFFNRKIIKGYVLVDSDKDGFDQKNKVLQEENYSVENVFEINDITGGANRCTLEDLFKKEYTEEAVKEEVGLNIILNAGIPLMEQVKINLKENKKLYREIEKEKIKKAFFKKIKRLRKEDLKKEKYYNFFEKINQKISV